MHFDVQEGDFSKIRLWTLETCLPLPQDTFLFFSPLSCFFCEEKTHNKSSAKKRPNLSTQHIVTPWGCFFLACFWMSKDVLLPGITLWQTNMRIGKWAFWKCIPYWAIAMCYCWWTKSCTTKDDDYPILLRVLTIPGGAGFRPSTVC